MPKLGASMWPAHVSVPSVLLWLKKSSFLLFLCLWILEFWGMSPQCYLQPFTVLMTVLLLLLMAFTDYFRLIGRWLLTISWNQEKLLTLVCSKFGAFFENQDGCFHHERKSIYTLYRLIPQAVLCLLWRHWNICMPSFTKH